MPTAPRKPSSYEFLKKHQPEHHLVTDYDVAMDSYKSWLQAQNVDYDEEKQEIVPILKAPMDANTLFIQFKRAFQFVNEKEFDEKANNSESYIFAKTLSYYFAKSKRFFESPLINPISKPCLTKGLLVIGGFGCGKTSIFEAFHHLFFQCQSIKIKINFERSTPKTSSSIPKVRSNTKLNSTF